MGRRGHRDADNEPQLAEQHLNQSLRVIHSLGVAHKDVRKESIVWNNKQRRFMVIDFHMATLSAVPRHPLAKLVPNKRSRGHDERFQLKETLQPTIRETQFENDKQRDLIMAKSIFRSAM